MHRLFVAIRPPEHIRDLLIDASVRGKLDSLRLSLRKARLTAGPATPGGTT